jgi:hypothetical protein
LRLGAASTSQPQLTLTTGATRMKRASGEATYRDEKAKRGRNRPHDELMADAKRAFDKMLSDERAARKGGRPKKTAEGKPGEKSDK